MCGSDAYIYKFDSNHALIAMSSQPRGFTDSADLDISPEGRLALGSRLYKPKIIEANLSTTVAVASTGYYTSFVAWGAIPEAGPGAVSGKIYWDKNGDGTLNSEDVGTGGQKAFVDINSNGKLDAGDFSAETDADGNYTIINVPAGNHRMYPEPAPGWKYTAPVNRYADIVVTSGGTTSAPNMMVNAWVDSPDYDASFGNGGKVIGGIVGSGVDAAAQTPDGKLITVRRDASGLGIARLNEDGKPDASFGSGGIVTAGMLTSAFAKSMHIDGDGRMYLLFYTTDYLNPHGLAVARFLPDGSRDTGFGANGIASVPFSWTANDMYVAADGRIVVVSNRNAARYTSAGQLDTSFGGIGYITLSFGTDTFINAVGVNTDDSMIVAGSRYVSGELYDRAFVARVTAAGALDSSFAAGGFHDYGTPVGGSEFFDLIVQDDGKILVGGYLHRLGSTVARLLPSGWLDPTYGAGGPSLLKQYSPAMTDTSSGFWYLAQKADKSLYVVTNGYGTSKCAPDVIAVELFDNGAVDTSFSNWGRAIISLSWGYDRPQAAFVQPDGKLVIGVNASGGNGVLVRLNEQIPGATLRGKTYVDKNQNRQQDAGEPPLPGQMVVLDVNMNLLFDWNEPRTTADMDGNYEFRGVQQGPVVVAPLPDFGWLTVPPTFMALDTTGEETISSLDFGLFEYKRLEIVAWNFELRFPQPLATFTFNHSLDADYLSHLSMLFFNHSDLTFYRATNVIYVSDAKQAVFEMPKTMTEGNYTIFYFAHGAVTTGAVTTDLVPMRQDVLFNTHILLGDSNQDRKVDTVDFNNLAGSFGTAGTTFASGDFNFDGTVNSLDFNIFIGRYGKSLPPHSTGAAPLFASELFEDAETELPDELA